MRIDNLRLSFKCGQKDKSQVNKFKKSLTFASMDLEVQKSKLDIVGIIKRNNKFEIEKKNLEDQFNKFKIKILDFLESNTKYSDFRDELLDYYGID